jgi:histidyl-tRNA synthetase
MSMLTSLSGYPEWLPEDQLVVQQVTELIRRKFELFGFAPIETRVVEPLSTLLAKGETDKEIYLLRRLQAAGDDDGDDKRVGLHFDLTVPLARYVLENRRQLEFPFRRYQIQKAWRGETPGSGRYREFLQADIDIIEGQHRSVSADVEIIQAVSEVMAALPIPPVRLHVNNRKLLEGFCLGLGIERITQTLRILDKLAKIGEQEVLGQLAAQVSLPREAATQCLALAGISGTSAAEVAGAVTALGVAHPLLDEGLDELASVLLACEGQAAAPVMADLSIVRGLDYYTGTVCETKFVQFPRYPTVAAGGRYDNLVADSAVSLPGVGMSIGITRILGLVLHEGLLRGSRKTPSCVLVALVSDERRGQSLGIARRLRARGIACEVYPRPVRYGQQIQYADRKGIPFVWFPPESGEGDGQVRDLRSKAQVSADEDIWVPPAEDLSARVIADGQALERVLATSPYR